jgi:hypothetical protein
MSPEAILVVVEEAIRVRTAQGILSVATLRVTLDAAGRTRTAQETSAGIGRIIVDVDAALRRREAQIMRRVLVGHLVQSDEQGAVPGRTPTMVAASRPLRVQSEEP